MIPFQHELNVRYGTAEDRLPEIQRVLAENPGPFTYTGSGTYLVGGDSVAVIDPGPALDSHFDALIRALDGRRVSHILVTHTHLDHSPLARRLAEATGAPTYGFGPHGSGRKAGLDGEAVEAGADMDFEPDITLGDGDSVVGEGWSLKAVHTPGHTSNHLCFFWPERRILFTGDHVMGWSTTVVSPPDGDMRAYINSLDTLAALDAEVLVPTHGPLIRDAGAYIAALKAHRLEREAQVLHAVSAGISQIDDVVKRLYADIDPWLHPAAARSVLSHLIDLVERGKITADGPPTLAAKYTLTS